MPPGSSEATVQGQTLILPDSPGLTLDQRAMTLATAVSVDFDYFSRHSGSGLVSLIAVLWGQSYTDSVADSDSLFSFGELVTDRRMSIPGEATYLPERVLEMQERQAQREQWEQWEAI